MAEYKQHDVWQYGDFQTPYNLAVDVCALLSRLKVAASAIIEPTCGRGAFLAAATDAFPKAHTFLGIEINNAYVEDARQLIGAKAHIEQGDFFGVDWNCILKQDGPWLVLGNPPWVTNTDLSLLKSNNLPTKSNFQKHQGLDAITGKSNFDISEWMLLEQIKWLKKRTGWIAMLVKTSVARKVLRQTWRRGESIGRAAIFKIDAMHHFNAAVDACLFVLPIGISSPSQECDVFDSFVAEQPISTLGFYDGSLVSNVKDYLNYRHLIGTDQNYIWRSGVKHDCSRVMELSEVEDGLFENGFAKRISLERDFVFPMLKSADVANGRSKSNRFMIVTQKEIGANTSGIAASAPKTWRYLIDHADLLRSRGSTIYKGKPSFSVFGVGAYTFSPWKIAISGFYKQLKFLKVGPVENKPVVFDDTVYFLPCRSEEEADFVLSLVQSPPCSKLISAMVFNDEKRPITAEILKRVSLERVASSLGFAEEYWHFVKPDSDQLQLALSA